MIQLINVNENKQFTKDYDFPEGLNSTHLMALMNLNFLGSASMSFMSKRLNMEKGFGTKHRKYMAGLMNELDEKKREEFYKAMDIVTKTIVSFSRDEEMCKIMSEITQQETNS
jgi:hypothetical protein